jgi:phenylalanyl-tRNA synthetase alpha chain
MEIQKILEALNPHERKILPYLKDRKLIDICKKSNLDKTSVLRALEFLQNKGIVKLNISKKKIVELGINGSLYLKKGLPERRLLDLLNDKRIISLEEGKKQSNLSEEEFKVSLGVLKRKALIELKNGNILFNGSKEEISKKTLEELFLENLPIEYDLMTPEQLFAFKNLQNRKSIIEINYETNVFVELTELGEKILSLNIKSKEMIEQLNPEILKKESNWKGKLFRRYDVSSPVPELYGGKRHFVNQSIDYARKIWTEMGFKEMSGDLIQSSFWNFDALFTPQDHPVREMHDTFFINKKSELPDKKISLKVKEAHERGVNGSKGWRYTWDAEESKRLVLRTHTTCLSSHTLYNLKKEEIPSKFFAIGKCFRNETVDWSHVSNSIKQKEL